ncbi:SDR family NAD(P)-dependent oxidoreductase [Mycolicibacterium vaccae]|uniref:Short-chain dehydrogenase/reductase SDR n=1 Tax=Mycolicibacterium vaccae ATCC 25954 TaxID=1194972 RepID=K0V5N9_MYCVA|nr:SDR family oxidoreductase [Mycolicibacterium vaccae]ANI40282.1 short-chain dehydrogenase [Mycolicibacterium vaccae 95051]EJZ10118.1 short-chain dehydrogenase/reductase SDR [Mycolicibacterium vaccae ATCC 25954]
MMKGYLDKDLQGKVAIVTGAASGIGRATTRLFTDYGMSVVAEDLNPDVEREFADIESVQALVGDVGEERTAVNAVNTALDRFGRVDILVNNAGTIVNKPVVDTTLDDWNRILSTNVTGAFLHTREAMKAMIPHGSGSIVNIGSYACFQAFPTISAYAASKGALAQLTRTAALEGIDHGIRVNAIGVGDTVTNILGDPGALSEHGKGAPIGRAADPREIADAVAFLASGLAAYAVGAVWMLDGGMSVAVPN